MPDQEGADEAFFKQLEEGSHSQVQVLMGTFNHPENCWSTPEHKQLPKYKQFRSSPPHAGGQLAKSSFAEKGSGEQEVDHEPAVAVCLFSRWVYQPPGVHKKESCQLGKVDPSTLPSSGEPCPVLHSLSQERRGHSGPSPEKTHGNH